MTRTRQHTAVRRITLHHAARRAALASGWGRRHRTITHRPNGVRA
ncbi:hypothetical protein OU787_12120 [Kitasatospora sp. YST-16]|nr:hypothetical protein [Kitasatospora sp. YST-16]WAL72181.1 hypothetical protein OU787_12120 [Kitasatospora sp. YST-16]WNW38223.1 hypothetical protein RKE32_12075 [Streptomyces sp. Li-HN-5-13]